MSISMSDPGWKTPKELVGHSITLNHKISLEFKFYLIFFNNINMTINWCQCKL